MFPFICFVTVTQTDPKTATKQSSQIFKYIQIYFHNLVFVQLNLEYGRTNRKHLQLDNEMPGGFMYTVMVAVQGMSFCLNADVITVTCKYNKTDEEP